MPAWAGGDCPECGENMPPALIHCQSCRALLNPDLQEDSVVIPAFIPLPEVESLVEVEPKGHYVNCPACDVEIRIASKYEGSRVSCNHCGEHFVHAMNPSRIKAFYARCPHCDELLRASMKYLGKQVSCKHCNGHIHCVASQVDAGR